MSDPIRASDMMAWGWNMARGLAGSSASGYAINAALGSIGTDAATALVVSNIAAAVFTGTVTIGGAITAHQGSSGDQYWPVQLSGTQTVSVSAIAPVSVSAIPAVSVSAIPSVLASISAIPAISVSAIPSILASISAIPAISVSAIPSILASISAIPAISVSANPSQLVSVSAIPSIAVSAITLPGVTITGGTMTVNAATVASHAVSVNNSIAVSAITLPGVTVTGGTMTVNAATVASHAVSVNNVVSASQTGAWSAEVALTAQTGSTVGIPGGYVLVRLTGGNSVTPVGTIGVSFPLGNAVTGSAASVSNTAGSSSVTIVGNTAAAARTLAIAGYSVGNGNTGANTAIFFTTNTAGSGDIFTIPIAPAANTGDQWNMQYPFTQAVGQQCTLGVRMSTSGTLYVMGAVITL
jgi:hypothetical protein